MTKQAFSVEGDFQMGRLRQHFRVECAATDEAGAREHVLTDLGSRHSVPRRLIDIQSVTPLAASDVHSSIVRKQLE